MADCPKCDSSLFVARCLWCHYDASPLIEEATKPCPKKCAATIHVQESLKGAGVPEIAAKLNGAGKPTDPHGFHTITDLDPGTHEASIDLTGLEDKWAHPIGESGAAVKKSIAVDQKQFYTFTVDPLTKLKVVVKRRHDSNGVVGATVKLTPSKSGNVPAKTEIVTPAGGEATFERLRHDSYKIEIALDDPGKKKFVLESAEAQHPLDMSKNPDEHIFWARLTIHLRLKYTDPEAAVRAFPKDFPVKVEFDDGTSQDLKVLDDEGYFKFDIEDDKKKKFTLNFNSGKTRYLVHPVRNAPAADAAALARTDAPKTKVFDDPNDDQLREWTTAGKRFFALPKTWSLVHSEWDAPGVTIPKDGKIEIKDGVGEVDKPAELTLKPKFQYVRFEFHDRKYGAVGEAHDGKRVSIPPVVLKGCRESTDAGAPVNPTSGTHDTVSNWMIKPTDAEKACQVLPWILLKKHDGSDLPKFNNKMLLEFGWENGFVQSAGKEAADRKIVVLPADDAKRKPGKDRQQYYDLPKLWKSKYYYTRLTSTMKNKFFDKFDAADDVDLDASLIENNKLTFSLDDIVLVDKDGKQETIKDKKADDSPVDLSEHSRFAILELDRKDKKFNVKVYEDTETKYWSNVRFIPEAAGGARRNVIAKYPPNPRVVVFCSEFHDIFDKRTEATDCSGKKIVGARAAKIEDTDVSSKKVLLKEDSDVTNAYIGYKSSPRIHYLHYWDVDGATVYGALVGYWSARFEPKTSKGGTDADVTKFRTTGLALAMKRWNDKDYYFEENDDKTDMRIKHFCLFEAKGVETAPGAHTDTGGKHICKVKVRDNGGGSSAAVDGSSMTMRTGGAADEGESWGNAIGNLPNIPKFEGGSAHPKCAFAHELGHSALVLFDSYLTASGKLCATGNSNDELSDNLCGYESHETEQKDGQEYYGMPYELDTGAMMFENRAEPRLRYYWLRANWLNDQAKAGGIDKLPEFLGGRRFRAAYEAKGKPKLKYHREEGDRNIYEPSKPTAVDYGLGNHGKCNIHLYRLGDDEFARILRGGPYKSILVVALKICVKFDKVMPWAKKGNYISGDIVSNAGSFYSAKNDVQNKDWVAGDWNEVKAFDANVTYSAGDKISHGGSMHKFTGASGNPWTAYPADLTEAQKINQIETLNKKINAMFADAAAVGKFKFYGGGEFSPALMRIFPQWSYESDPGGAHLTLTYSQMSEAFQPNGANIRAGTECDESTLIRYILGKLGDDPTKWATEGLTGDLTRADLGKLSDWMNSNADGKDFIVADNS